MLVKFQKFSSSFGAVLYTSKTLSPVTAPKLPLRFQLNVDKSFRPGAGVSSAKVDPFQIKFQGLVGAKLLLKFIDVSLPGI